MGDDNTREVEKVLVLSSLSLFTKSALNVSNPEIVTFLRKLYEIHEVKIASAGGTIIKHMGDATLMTFPATDIPKTINLLKSLKKDLDSWAATTNLSACTSDIKCHIGKVVETHIGSQKQYDIFGNALNELFKMKGNGLFISPALKARI